MRYSSYRYFIRKRNYSNKKMHLLGYIMATICFSLICFTLTFPRIFNRAYRDVDALLPTGLENCVVINMESTVSETNIISRSEEGKNFLFDLLEADEVYGMGDYDEFRRNYNLSYEGIDYSSIMQEISDANEISIADNELAKNIQTIAYNYYFIDFYQFDLYKGDFDVIEELENGDVILYLGYNFKDIPIGASFTDYNYLRDTERTIKVGGIIAQGEEILDIQAASTNFKFDASYGHNLDNMVIFIIGKYSDDDYMNTYNTLPVAFKEGTDYETGVAKIRELAAENGIRVTVSSMESKLQTQLAAYDVTLNAVAAVSPIAFLITIILILTVQLLISVMRNEEIGVWLSNGLTRKEVLIILVIDNLKKMIISSLLGSAAACIYLTRILNLTEGERNRIFFDIYGYGPLCTLGLAVLTGIVLAVLSFWFIGKRSLPEIINNSERKSGGHKLFRTNSLFAYLFMVSFVASFIIMYYGLDLYHEYTKINTGKAAFSYAASYDIFINGYSDDTVQPDLGITKGNLYEKVRVQIGTKEYGTKWAYLVINQNEQLVETANGEPVGMVEKSETPICVIGDRWADNIFEKNGEQYIKIYDTDVKVLAVLDSNSLTDRDKRIYIFANTLNPDIMLNWFGYGYDRGIYEGMMEYTSISGEGDIDNIEQKLTEIYGVENISISRDSGYWAANESEIKSYISMMKGFIAALSALSIFNMLFLSLVWSKTYAYEFMVKRIFGYKTIMLLPGILKTIVLYEIPAFLVSLILTLAYELIFNDFGAWINNLTNGYFIVAGVFVGLAIILAVKPLFWIAEARPADYVSCKE